MPCLTLEPDPLPFDPHNNPQAEMLCEVLSSLLPEDVSQFSKPLQGWWKAHQARDAKKRELETAERELKEAQEALRAKQERLAKLQK